MHDVGDLIPLAFTVVDPRTQSRTSATVTCAIEHPDGTTSTLPVTEESPGRYTTIFTPVEPGRYVERWDAVDVDGQPIAAKSDVINVGEGAAVALISVAEAREHLNIPAGEHVEDEELRGFITAATAAVERHLNQVVARRTIVEYHDIPLGRPRSRLFLHRTPLLTVTSIETLDGDQAWDPDALVVDSRTGMLDTVNGTPFAGSLRATYVAGMRSVPGNVLLATKIIVEHLWQTQRVPNLSAPGFAGEPAPTPGLAFALPNRALELLGGAPPVVA